MKKTITLIALFFFTITFYPQSTQDKAKAYYFEAVNAYNEASYSKAIQRLNETEKLLGSTNAIILNLKIKAYYELKDYKNAKLSLDKFSKEKGAEDDLKKETFSYIIKIEDGLQEEENEHLKELKRIGDNKKALLLIIEQNRIKKIEEEVKREEDLRLEEEERARELERIKMFKKKEKADFIKWHKEKYKDSNRNVFYKEQGKDFPKWGVVNGKFEVVIPFKYENISHIDGDIYSVLFKLKLGMVDVVKGMEILKPKYEPQGYFDTSFKFKEGLAVIRYNGKSGFVNKVGEIVIPFEFIGSHSFSEGLAAVSNETDTWGYINTNGNIIIPYKYFNVHSFSEGLAAVSNEKDTWGYINTNGKLIIPYKFCGGNGLDFENGIAFVRKKGKCDYIARLYSLALKINKKGRRIR